jgi:hypothetical protein
VNFASVIMVAGWEEVTALNNARNGYIYQISQDMLDSYIGLHSPLVIVRRDSFSLAQPEIDHHVEKLQHVRALN